MNNVYKHSGRLTIVGIIAAIVGGVVAGESGEGVGGVISVPGAGGGVIAGTGELAELGGGGGVAQTRSDGGGSPANPGGAGCHEGAAGRVTSFAC